MSQTETNLPDGPDGPDKCGIHCGCWRHVFGMIRDSFRGPMRCCILIVWIESLAFTALAVLVAIRFFQVTELWHRIMYATVFLMAFIAVVAIKLWYWMYMNRNATSREIESLRRQVADLTDLVKKRREP